MRKRKTTPVSPMCSAPGCPLRWERVASNGKAYCRYHHGVSASDRAAEITKRLHEAKPIFNQIKQLYGLNASQLMGIETVPVDPGLPPVCCRMDGETYKAWVERLIKHLDFVKAPGCVR